MSLEKKLWDFVKMNEDLNREIESAKFKLMASQMVWMKSTIDIVDTQMLILAEDLQLEAKLGEIGGQRLADSFEDSGSESPISNYKTVVDVKKWTDFRLRLAEANADFHEVKMSWVKPKEELTIWMTMEEIKSKVKEWEKSEAMATCWASKYEEFLEEWENLKLGLEKCIQYCANLAANNKEEN